MLTPEERLARAERKKEKRKIFGETFLKAAALFLAVVFVYSVTYVAFGKGSTVYQGVQVDAGSLVVSGGSSSGGSSSGGAGSSDDVAAPASNEAEEAAKAINAATAAAATAGYDWNRTSEYTKPVDVGSATDVLNKVIQGVDPNANVDSVVGGFIGIGKKEAKIEKGKDAAECIGYHGSSYKLKATSLKASDLKDLTVSDGTYTFKLADVNTPKKDGSNSLNRLTDDIVIQEEVSQEIKDQVGSAVTVTSLVGVYSNINVKVVIADGKLTEMTYSYDADVSELGLKVAVVTVKGTGAMHTEASYTNFVY
ncbi:MAG: hypothetical protein Q4E21_07725 [Clostridia bacterium]|nr:hypothetical protein [Clostridia bacterium]